MTEGELPFSIEAFKFVVPRHNKTVVVPSGKGVRFKQAICPGSHMFPAEIFVEENKIIASCVDQCGVRIEWDESVANWVVR